ncbi:transport system permease protein [Solidesulfovibrio fructosivorans JJ]]|uniref:Transport system permease protein n=1 Tax=Solidesulfovibrio fructosivorans JJ] TaxID=596151 RepID=E1JU65_SOLFR|nr:iron ABC transporter permease [Solidesulfovibrio fructosivorans]EFL51995.1 transport system permease protein [Solidesulfovibrio fructosivorans JJ]]
MTRVRPLLAWGGLSALLLALAALSLCLGKMPVSAKELGQYALGGLDPRREATLSNLLWAIRGPRILAALAAGAALAASGSAYQALLVNPLVSPGILGVLAGASFGAALGLLWSWSLAGVQGLAFGFGLAAAGLAVLLSLFQGEKAVMSIVLGGVISGALFSALVSLVKYVADPYNQLPSIVFFLMGSLALVDGRTTALACLPMLAAVCGLLLLARPLDAMTMGDDEAASLGVRVGQVRGGVIALATLASALTVVVGGVIGWVGLIAPHLARRLVGPSMTRLLPASALVGAAYLLAMDTLARTAFPVEAPVGILTALCGIPCFVLLLRARRGNFA